MKVLSRLLSHKLIKAGMWVTIGSMVVNVLNYAFNVIMGRLLGPSLFGELTALFSLLIITSVPSSIINLIMSKLAAEYNSRKDLNSFSTVYRVSLKYSIITSIVLVIISWILTPFLANFLSVNPIHLVICALLLPTTIIGAIYNGSLQGFHLFGRASISSVISTVIKLVLSITSVYAGFRVGGAVTSVLIGSIIALIYTILVIRPYVENQNGLRSSLGLQALFSIISTKYLLNVTITTLLLAVIGNIDVVLAKHFLSAESAGHYSALSLSGKVLTYGAGAFVGILFPIVAAAGKDGRQQQQRLLGLSLLMSGVIGSFIILLFTLFPFQFIQLLFGANYLDTAPYLTWMGIASFAGMISTGLINYFMAIQESSYIIPLTLSVFVQVVLIFISAHTIQTIAGITMVLNIGVMIMLFFVYGYSAKKGVVNEDINLNRNTSI
ncbi:oligosaccharide flippase family protein [candidate division WWE3 bacterium]|nr:oligosaccharide flippase family protein [candidate division WWE3 bacterium]